ncbi:MAG: ABC transporter permease [Deltaproteobacteria bacterium]|nr:ABC transporter permease [Deltaproteobacteria bacterium]MBW1963023.1 ABC transporter permease [Deltaproteobacteria bacterium]MBW1993242.1 ABC transporter permease [Deltaproteobacteria bacterium]MBW2151244.1 ABC transporter permease [Deltaproteobacteria bacterium]
MDEDWIIRRKPLRFQWFRRLGRSASSQFRLFRQDKLGMIGLFILAAFILVAVFAPYLAPHDPMETLNKPTGRIARMVPPSWQFPFGTDRLGRDIFSQVIIGSRVAVGVGLLCAIMVVFIGTNIGLISGYYGGKIDDLLMRMTDIIYGIPFLPFAVILVALLGPGLFNIVLAIVLISWRSTARVIRAQVLTLKERAFIEAARVAGASDFRIMYRHIMPNVLPLSFVYGALSMGWAILTEASVSFLGYGDPLLISWGKIIFMCYVAQAITVAWWWVMAPGLAIMLLVLSGFFIGRAYEQVVNPRLRQR